MGDIRRSAVIDLMRGLCVLLFVLDHIDLRFRIKKFDMVWLAPESVRQALFHSGYFVVTTFFSDRYTSKLGKSATDSNMPVLGWQRCLVSAHASGIAGKSTKLRRFKEASTHKCEMPRRHPRRKY